MATTKHKSSALLSVSYQEGNKQTNSQLQNYEGKSKKGKDSNKKYPLHLPPSRPPGICPLNPPTSVKVKNLFHSTFSLHWFQKLYILPHFGTFRSSTSQKPEHLPICGTRTFHSQRIPNNHDKWIPVPKSLQ